MYFFVLAFLLGDLCVEHCATLPKLSGIVILLSCSLILFTTNIFSLKTKSLKLCCSLSIAFLLGMLWTTWYVNMLMRFELPHLLEKQTLQITGIVSSLPITNQHETKFLFHLDKIFYQEQSISANALIKLSIHQNFVSVHVGEKWQFYARLKRIHSTLNPGGFDFEAAALEQKIRASGYIITKLPARKIAHHWYHYPIEQLREHIKQHIDQILPADRKASWLLALIIGERGNVDPMDWQILRKTGTNHLMAIGGLHIGFVCGFVFFLIFKIWRRVHPRLSLLLPAKEAASFFALLIAIIYSAFAGFSIPTQRAILMLSVFIFTLLSRRKINPWISWSAAILIVLIANPLTILSASFWLSFTTLALIIYGMHGRLCPQGLWWQWGRVQWVIGIGLIPLTVFIFNEFSLVGFLANCIAIPWLGFLILPFCLFSASTLFFALPIAQFSLFLADKSLVGLWWVLTWLSHLKLASWQLTMPNQWIFMLTMSGIILWLAPRGFPGKGFSFIFLLPLLCYQPNRPIYGEYWMTLLDVGQGLALVIQTKSHALLYDAGPRYRSGFDTGETIVLPFLLSQGIKKIDLLVISHGDNDHFGGVNALIEAIKIKQIKTSTPHKILTNKTEFCFANDHWEWDGVRFAFLYPFKNTLGLGNDSSCVLKIDNGSQSLLLTGDIEKFAEKKLLTFFPKELSSDILVAPHHGSNTSGLKKFIAAVSPQYVLYAVGYLNRYKFPHQRIVNSYHAIGAKQYNTAQSGAIKFSLTKGPVIREPFEYRQTHSKYWNSKSADKNEKN